MVNTELSGFYLGAIMKRELIACFERRCDTCGEVRKCATFRFPTLHMSGKGLRKRKFEEAVTFENRLRMTRRTELADKVPLR